MWIQQDIHCQHEHIYSPSSSRAGRGGGCDMKLPETLISNPRVACQPAPIPDKTHPNAGRTASECLPSKHLIYKQTLSLTILNEYIKIWWSGHVADPRPTARHAMIQCIPAHMNSKQEVAITRCCWLNFKDVLGIWHRHDRETQKHTC